MCWALHKVRWWLGIAQYPLPPVAAAEGQILQPVRNLQELSVLGWMAAYTPAVHLLNLSISAASEMGMALLKPNPREGSGCMCMEQLCREAVRCPSRHHKSESEKS